MFACAFMRLPANLWSRNTWQGPLPGCPLPPPCSWLQAWGCWWVTSLAELILTHSEPKLGCSSLQRPKLKGQMLVKRKGLYSGSHTQGGKGPEPPTAGECASLSLQGAPREIPEAQKVWWRATWNERLHYLAFLKMEQVGLH